MNFLKYSYHQHAVTRVFNQKKTAFNQKQLAHAVFVLSLISGQHYALASPLSYVSPAPAQQFLSDKALSTPTPTAATQSLQTALTSAHEQNLAARKAWLRLLYYPENITRKQPFESRVNNRFNPQASQRQFFASAQGAKNPQAELDEMLTQLFHPTKKNNDSVQCRFPARTQWLIENLAIDTSSLPKQYCDALDSWLQKINPQSVSLIFASEYLDSPPSAFAHSFLRFDNADLSNQYYLNFTPKVSDGEHFLKFAYKSSIGGNAGEFTMTNYQQGIKEYLQDDGRNVWQYQLNLTDKQVKQLAYRTWEIKDQNLPYYLLSDNCASEILVLLNSIFPDKNFLVNHSPMISPAQVVRMLNRENLIRSTNFSPSTPTVMQAQLNARNAANHPKNLNNTHQNIALSSQILPSRDNPVLANPLSRFDIGVSQQSFDRVSGRPKLDSNQAITLNYRMVYRDALDKIDGYPIGSQLTALSMGLSIHDNADQQDSVQLEQLGLFDVRSLHPINSAKKGISWGGNIGLQRVFDGIKGINSSNKDDRSATDNHLVANISGEFGKSVALGSAAPNTGDMPANICYGLGTIAAQFGKGLYHGYRAGLGVNVGCNAELRPNWRAISELKLPFWISGDSDNESYWQPKLSIGSQYDINQTNAIRVTASREWLPKSDIIDNVDEVGLKWLHYFD